MTSEEMKLLVKALEDSLTTMFDQIRIPPLVEPIHKAAIDLTRAANMTASDHDERTVELSKVVAQYGERVKTVDSMETDRKELHKQLTGLRDENIRLKDENARMKELMMSHGEIVAARQAEKAAQELADTDRQFAELMARREKLKGMIVSPATTDMPNNAEEVPS